MFFEVPIDFSNPVDVKIAFEAPPPPNVCNLGPPPHFEMLFPGDGDVVSLADTRIYILAEGYLGRKNGGYELLTVFDKTSQTIVVSKIKLDVKALKPVRVLSRYILATIPIKWQAGHSYSVEVTASILPSSSSCPSAITGELGGFTYEASDPSAR